MGVLPNPGPIDPELLRKVQEASNNPVASPPAPVPENYGPAKRKTLRK